MYDYLCFCFILFCKSGQSGQDFKKIKTNSSTAIEIEPRTLVESNSREHLLPLPDEPQTSASASNSRMSFLTLTNNSELRLTNSLNSSSNFDSKSRPKSQIIKETNLIEEQRQNERRLETNLMSNTSGPTELLTNTSDKPTVNTKDDTQIPRVSTASTSSNFNNVQNNNLQSLEEEVLAVEEEADDNQDEVNRENINPSTCNVDAENEFFNLCNESTIPDETLIGPNRATPPPSYDEVLSIEHQTSENVDNLFETL